MHGTFGCSVGQRRNCISHQLTISLLLHHLTVSSQVRSHHDIENCHCRSAEGSVVTSCLLLNYPKFQNRFRLNRIAMLVLPIMLTLKPYIIITTCYCCLQLVSQVTKVWFQHACLPAILIFNLQPGNGTNALKKPPMGRKKKHTIAITAKLALLWGVNYKNTMDFLTSSDDCTI